MFEREKEKIFFVRKNLKMSLGYAEKLSFIEDVGQVGMAEFFDPSHVLQCKVTSPLLGFRGVYSMIDRC